MNRLFFILLTAILASCGNKPKTVTIVKEKLDANLVSGVLKTINTNKYLDFPDIPLNESCIVVSFEVNPEDADIYFSDSTVQVYHYNTSYCNKAFMSFDSIYNHIYDYYKGILDIDGINVAIFDFGNFGEKYYNADNLKKTPLNRFKPYPMEYILACRYYIENSKLQYWDP